MESRQRDLATDIRSITKEEIAFFGERGWVKLEGLFSRSLADELLLSIKRVMDSRGAGNASMSSDQQSNDYIASINLRAGDAFISDLVAAPCFGEAASALLGVRPLRLLSDSVFVKRKASPNGETASGTPWHQDFPSMPIDRGIACNIWVAAVEITPDMGSLQYLSGSHREPPLGNGNTFNTADGAVGQYPCLLDKYEISPAFTLQPGDALAHHAMTVHFSEPNRSLDRDRWAWASQFFDAKARYTGAPSQRTDGLGLAVHDLFDHPLFPLVGEESSARAAPSTASSGAAGRSRAPGSHSDGN